MSDVNLVPVLILGSSLITGFAIWVICSVIINKQRQIRSQLANQQLGFEYNRSLLSTRIETQEATLNMIAQELHDNVTQALTGCFLQMAAAGGYVSDPKGQAVIEATKEHLNAIISSVRMMSHNLATGMAEKRDIQEAIQAELNRIGTFGNISCNFYSDSIYELPPDQRLLLFRIVQEALHNALKHAMASKIDVMISSTDTTYTVSVSDNGVGFDTEQSQARNSIGLANMQERAKLLKGAWNIVSSAGKGTTISVCVPIK